MPQCLLSFGGPGRRSPKRKFGDGLTPTVAMPQGRRDFGSDLARDYVRMNRGGRDRGRAAEAALGADVLYRRGRGRYQAAPDKPSSLPLAGWRKRLQEKTPNGGRSGALEPRRNRAASRPLLRPTARSRKPGTQSRLAPDRPTAARLFALRARPTAMRITSDVSARVLPERTDPGAIWWPFCPDLPLAEAVAARRTAPPKSRRVFGHARVSEESWPGIHIAAPGLALRPPAAARSRVVPLSTAPCRARSSPCFRCDRTAVAGRRGGAARAVALPQCRRKGLRAARPAHEAGAHSHGGQPAPRGT